MYPWHIESVERFHHIGPQAGEWRPVFRGDEAECWAKLHEELDKPLPEPAPNTGQVPRQTKTPLRHHQHPAGYVYILKGNGLYKIGLSTRKPDARIAEYSPKLPFSTELVKVIESNNCHALEKELHRRFRSKHVRGEWYALTSEDLNGLD